MDSSPEAGRWFSGTPVSSTNKTDHRDITDIWLEVVLNTITLTLTFLFSSWLYSGHDTTASALSWSIYSLGKHKDIQEKVYREVKEVIGDKQYVDG
jgi:cytochrome P450